MNELIAEDGLEGSDQTQEVISNKEREIAQVRKQITELRQRVEVAVQVGMKSTNYDEKDVAFSLKEFFWHIIYKNILFYISNYKQDDENSLYNLSSTIKYNLQTKHSDIDHLHSKIEGLTVQIKDLEFSLDILNGFFSDSTLLDQIDASALRTLVRSAGGKADQLNPGSELSLFQRALQLISAPAEQGYNQALAEKEKLLKAIAQASEVLAYIEQFADVFYSITQSQSLEDNEKKAFLYASRFDFSNSAEESDEWPGVFQTYVDNNPWLIDLSNRLMQNPPTTVES